MRIFRDHRSGRELGSANMIITIMAAGVTLLFAKVLVDRFAKIRSTASAEVGSRKARFEAQKIMASAGFMVANSLVVCKEDKFENGAQCDWFPNRLGDIFEPNKFGFGEPKQTPEGLRFAVIPSQLKYSPTKQFLMGNGSITFSLIDARKNDDVLRYVEDRPKDLETIDKDYSLIKVLLTFPYKKGNKTETHRSLAYFRRPVAVLTTIVQTDSVCAGQCRSSVSSNPYPSCRGPQTVDESSKVDLVVRTHNNGPGVLYDLVYDREVCFYTGVGSNNCRTDKKESSEPVKVNLNNLLEPERYIEWVDQVTCKKFVQTTNNPTTTRRPQHLSRAGSVRYVLDARETSESSLEPFRMNHEVDVSEGTFPGIVNMIYVAPTH